MCSLINSRWWIALALLGMSCAVLPSNQPIVQVSIAQTAIEFIVSTHSGGATTLNGGQITSSQAAVDAGVNRFNSAGGTTITDIQNTAAYNASGSNITLGYTPRSPGIGRARGSASSTTTGGISGIAGNQAARTGDAGTGLAPIFNQDRVRADVQAQIQITAQVGPRASAAAGSYADSRYNDALRRGDTAEMQLWQEGGAGRVGLHALVGGLTGGADGARGAASSAVVAPQTVDMLQALGVPPEMSRLLVPLAGAAVGYGTGGVGGAAAGFNEADNNASGSIARRAAVPMLQLCSSSVQCAAFFGSAAGVAGGGALLNQISNRAADLQTQNPNLTDDTAFVMALSERTAGAFVNTVTSWFAPTPARGPSTTTSPGTPLVPPAPLVTPANAPATAGSNNTGGSQLDQPQQPTGTPGSPAAAPVAGSNITATPMAQPQGPGIVMAVPPGDKGAITNGLNGVMGGMPVPTSGGDRVIGGSNNIVSEYPNGSRADAERVFDNLPLNGVRPIESGRGDWGRSGTLPDGTTVTVRPSADGRPTIEIVDRNRPDARGRLVSEIRFGRR